MHGKFFRYFWKRFAHPISRTGITHPYEAALKALPFITIILFCARAAAQAPASDPALLLDSLRAGWPADTARVASTLAAVIDAHPDDAVVARAATALVGMLATRNRAGDSARASAALTRAVARITDPGVSIRLKSAFPDIDWSGAERESATPDTALAVPIPFARRRALPDFAVPAIDSTGGLVAGSSLRGRVTLIDFWATWCAPCIAALPDLLRLYARLHGAGFDIVSVSMDTSPELVTRFRRKRFPMPWRHAYLAEGFGSPLVQEFTIEGIPWMVLVDREGRIAAEGMELHGAVLEKLVETLLAEPRQ